MLQVERAPPVLAALDRRRRLARDQRVSRVVVRERRLLDPREPLGVEHAHPLHGLDRRQALVVIDHDRDLVADRAPHRADDRDVLLHRRIADLGLDAGEAALRPILGHLRRAQRAVVADRAVGRDRLLDAAQEPRQRRAVAPRERVPQRHVDRRERDADETLRAEQPEAPRELLLDLGRRERLALHQRREVADQLGDRLQRHRRVREHDAVADEAVVEHGVGQHQRRLGDGAARGLVRLAHRHAHRAHARGRRSFGAGFGRHCRVLSRHVRCHRGHRTGYSPICSSVPRLRASRIAQANTAAPSAR